MRSFKDIDNKKGEIGDKVVEVFYGNEKDEIKTVKSILSKGRGGTRIYFEEGGYGKSSDYRLKNKNSL